MATMLATRIRLELDCFSEPCNRFASPLYEQMAQGGYEECAVMPLPETIGEWRAEHRTARKRADRAQRRGYRFTEVRRHERAGEIRAINLSAPHRQGRPMERSYREPPTDTPLPDYACPRHAIRTYGVEDPDGILVGYLWCYRAGELALISQILGHADHLENEIMYLLAQGAIAAEAVIAPGGQLVYNRWDSGGDGLRFFKARLGFEPMTVEWLPW